MATNATINHLAFHGTGYELVNDTLNVTVFSSQGTAESIPSYAKASTSQDGLMSKEDKAKLDNFKTADQYVTVVSGKDLSTNDFTNAYKQQLDDLASNPPTVDTSQFVQKDGTKVLSDVNYTQSEKTKLNGIAENAQVNKIEFIKVDGTALPISDKAVNIVLSGKVDTVAGKQLSTNDFTNDYKNKIDGATVKASTSQDGLMSKEDYSKLSSVEAGANKYVLSKATSTSLGGVKIVEGNGLYMDGDTLKVNATEAQGDFSLASTVASGLMSSSDKKALESLKAITDATTVKSGYMSTSDKIKLNGIDTLYATKSEVSSAVASVYKPKGSVNSFSDLPSNASEGDVYNIKTAGGTDVNGNSIKAGDNVVKVSNGWDVLAGTVDLSGYATTVLASTSQNGLMSSSDKTKLNGIANGAQVNTIEQISLNGSAVTPTDKGVNISNASTTASGLMSSSDKQELNDLVSVIDTTDKILDLSKPGSGGTVKANGTGLFGVGGTVELKGRTGGTIDLSGTSDGGSIYIAPSDDTLVSGHIYGAVTFNNAPIVKELKVQDTSLRGGTISANGQTNDAGLYYGQGGHGGVLNLRGGDVIDVNRGTVTGGDGGIIYLEGGSARTTVDGGVANAGKGGQIHLGATGSLFANNSEIFIPHANVVGDGFTSIQGNVQFINKPHFNQSATGISLQSGNVNIPTDTYDSIMGNFTLTGNETELGYTLPTASPTVKGGIMVGNCLSMTSDSLNVTFSNKTLESSHANLSFPSSTIKSHLSTIELDGSNIDVSGASIGGGAFKILTPVTLTSSARTTFQGDVIFTSTPTFENGATGISLPTASQTVKGGVMVGKALKMTNESIGVDALEADDVYITTSDLDSIMNQFTVGSAAPAGYFDNEITVTGGFNVPASVSSSFGNYDTITFGNNIFIEAGNVTVTNGTSQYVTFAKNVKFNSGIKVGDSMSVDIGAHGSLVSDYADVDLRHSYIKVGLATVSGDPVFLNKISFNAGFNTANTVSSSFGTHSTVTATHSYIDLSSSDIHVANATVSGKPTFNTGFNIADSMKISFGKYDTIDVDNYGKLNLQNNSSLIADNSFVNLTNSELKFNSATISGSPVFTGTPTFLNGANGLSTTSQTTSGGASSFSSTVTLNGGFVTADSVRAGFGHYDTVNFGNYNLINVSNRSTVLCDHNNVDLNNSKMIFKNATISGSPVFTGTPQFDNGISTSTVMIPSSTFDSIMSNFTTVASSAKQTPSIVFSPSTESLPTLTSATPYSFSYTVTSDASSHTRYYLDTYLPEDHHGETVLSGLSSSDAFVPYVGSGTGWQTCVIVVPETTNYSEETFTYRIRYKNV